MYETDELINKIKKYMQDNEMSKYKMSQLAGLHINTLSKINTIKFNPTAKTLRSCEKVIKGDK